MEPFWTEVSIAAFIIYRHETRGKVQIAAGLGVLNMEVTGDPEDVVRVEFRFDRLCDRLVAGERGVMNMPLPRRCINAIVECIDENEVVQKTLKIDLI